MRIAIIDSIHPILGELLTGAGHECISLHHLEGNERREALQGMQGIVVRSKVLKKELLQDLKELRFIARVGAGLENIDREYCQANGVELLASPEGNRDGVGEHCVMQCLVLMKHVMRADAQVRRGLWLREENRGSDLQGRTVGIIGYGNMGSSFAQKLAGFDVRILAHDKYRQGFGNNAVKECTLDEVLAESDIISLHLPLNDETRHYADAAFFGRIKKPIHFLNTSRGAVVDTEALLDAVDSGRVLGAGLDVLEFEREDNSALDPAILPHVQKRSFACDRILLTPHIAGVTFEGARKLAVILAGKIIERFPHDTN
jgi:D-3-phosphoglycerate dehydrogenase / 2-oxoglutarate reductase